MAFSLELPAVGGRGLRPPTRHCCRVTCVCGWSPEELSFAFHVVFINVGSHTSLVAASGMVLRRFLSSTQSVEDGRLSPFKCPGWDGGKSGHVGGECVDGERPGPCLSVAAGRGCVAREDVDRSRRARGAQGADSVAW